MSNLTVTPNVDSFMSCATFAAMRALLKLPTQLLSDSVSHGNTTTGFQQLTTLTIPANTFLNNGDRLVCENSFKTGASVGPSAAFRIDFNGSTIFNALLAGLTPSANVFYRSETKFIRDSATTLKFVTTWYDYNSEFIVGINGTISGLTFTGPIDFSFVANADSVTPNTVVVNFNDAIFLPAA